VLLDLYASTDGDNWLSNTGWLGAAGTECTWYGVVCVGDHVTQLSLNGDNLTGSLPDLAALTELQSLWLVDNHLSGPLPDLLFFSKLQNVIVRGNQFSNTFPAWDPTAPLVAIDAGNNAFTGSIPTLSSTPTLQSAKFDGNWFTGPIPALSALTNLKHFTADGNQLTGPIPSLAGLILLKEFTVSGNDLTGTMPSIASLAALETFDVSDNHLSGPLPTAYPASLRSFHASNNSLSGTMPSLIATQLQTFRIDGNVQIAGQVASGPSPNTLQADLSALCPSGLLAANNSQIDWQWNTATGHVPWDYNGQCAQQPANTSPDLKIFKSHAGNFSQGQVGAAYSLTVHNEGAGATGGQVTVADVLPIPLTATAMSGPGWNCTVATTSCTRSDSLGAGANYPAITLTVNVAPDAPASVINAATVGGGGDTNTANNAASDLTTIDSASAGPDLTVTKSHAGNFIQGQDGAMYSLVVHNMGGAATTGMVTLTDTLPGTLTATAMSGPGWTCTPATATCTRSDALASGVSYPAVTLTVNVGANAPANVVNEATVSGGGETNSANDQASDLTAIDEATADLTLTKAHFGSFVQGQTGVAYILTARNVGNTATGGMVTVTDALPAPLTAVAISGQGWTCTLQTVSCVRSDPLPASLTYPAIELIVDVASDAPPSVTNTATVTGGGESNLANNSASDPTTIDPATADLLLSKTHTGNFSQGQTDATYSLIAYNNGNASTTGPVTVTDTLPAELTATGISGPGWACTLQTTSCVRSDPLLVGGSYPAITLIVNVAPGAPQTLTNTANVSGGGETDTSNDTATDATTIESASAGPDLTITKSHAGNFQRGRPGTYSLVAHNVGGAATSGTITVTDNLPQLPPSLVPTSMGGVGWSCNVLTRACTRSDPLASGASYPPITLTVDVAANAPSNVLNVATIGGGAQTNTGNDTASDFTTITPAGVTPQTIEFTSSAPTDAVVAGPPYQAVATASSGLAVALSIDATSATVCTIGNNDTVTFVGEGTCTINANQSGDDSYAPAPQVQQSFEVISAGGVIPQTIAFTSTAPVNAKVAGPIYLATAAATSGLPVVLTIDGSSTTVCAIDSGTVTFIGAGVCTIDANQGGNATYAPAPQVQQSFAVAGAGGVVPQTIAFTSVAPLDAIVGGPSYAATATASSGLPVVLTIDAISSTVCTIDNGTVTFIGAGPCVVDANQGGDATYDAAPQEQQSFDVASGGGASPQTITFTSTAPADAVVDGPSYFVTAIASSGLPVVLTIDAASDTVCTINNGTVLFVGAGTCTIDANQGGDATYAPASRVQQSFPIAGAGGVVPQTIAFTSVAPLDAIAGGPSYAATATASSGLPVVLTIDAISSTVCTIDNGIVTFIGAGACAIDANQGGDATWAPAPQVQQSFPVGAASGTTSQTITFTSTPPANPMVGGPAYLATAMATSGLPVVLSIDVVSGAVCSIDQGFVSFIGSGDCTIDANQGGDANYAPAPQVQQTFAVTCTPLPGGELVFADGFDNDQSVPCL
jgi:hypothetical protein